MRSFLGFGQVDYIGQTYTRSIKLAGISSQVVPLLFQWISYGASTTKPNINVLVNIANANCKAIDQIRSVYIDNLGSDNPIYVYFSDTGYCVVAAPNSSGWYPAYTNSKEFWVIGEGFLTGDIPQTFIMLGNVALPANVNYEINNAVALWRASPLITRGTSIYNSSLGIPALGDQLQSTIPFSLLVPNSLALWGTPYPSGFIYLTSLKIYGLNLLGSAPGQAGQLDIGSTGSAGILISPTFAAAAPGAYQPPGSTLIMDLTGLQTKLDATQSWRVNVATQLIAGGVAQVISSFTQQP